MPAGTAIAFNLDVAARISTFMARPYVTGESYQWFGSNAYPQLKAGWNQVTLITPARFHSEASQLGVQAMAPPRKVINRTLYIQLVSESR